MDYCVKIVICAYEQCFITFTSPYCVIQGIVICETFANDGKEINQQILIVFPLVCTFISHTFSSVILTLSSIPCGLSIHSSPLHLLFDSSTSYQSLSFGMRALRCSAIILFFRFRHIIHSRFLYSSNDNSPYLYSDCAPCLA